MSLASCPLPTATLIQAYSVRQFKMSTSPPADIIQDRSDALEERYTAPRSEKHTFPSIELFSREPWAAAALQDVGPIHTVPYLVPTNRRRYRHVDATVRDIPAKTPVQKQASRVTYVPPIP